VALPSISSFRFSIGKEVSTPKQWQV